MGQRKALYEKNGVKLIDINNTAQTVAVDKDRTMMVTDVQKHLEALWKCESFIMTRLFNPLPFTRGTSSELKDYHISDDWKQFFVRILVVPPNRYRPLNIMGSRRVEGQKNKRYKAILKANMAIRRLLGEIQKLSADPRIRNYDQNKKQNAQRKRKENWKSFKRSRGDEGDSDSSDDDMDEDSDSMHQHNGGVKSVSDLKTSEALHVKFQECRKQFMQQWESMQQQFNHLTDGEKNSLISRGSGPMGANVVPQGVRQLMEKKQVWYRVS